MVNDFSLILKNSKIFDSNKKRMLLHIYETLDEEDQEMFRNTFLKAVKEEELIEKESEKEKSDARQEFIEGIKKDYKEAYDTQILEVEKEDSLMADKIIDQM